MLHRIALITALFVLLVPGRADAQLQVVQTETRVHLRREPSGDARSIRVLRVFERLTARGSAVRGWGPVVTQRAESGWVSQRFVFETDPDADTATAAVTAAAGIPRRLGGNTVTVGLNAPAAAIDPAWYKQRPRYSVLRHATTDSACGPRGGEGGDAPTFRRKNRNDYPDTTYAITFAALRGLPLENGRDAGGQLVPADRPFSAAVERAIARFEGIAVTVTGFIAFMNQRGSVEGTNCGFSGTANTDWHIALTAGHRDAEGEGLIVEPTPRFTRRHTRWLRNSLWDRTGTSRSSDDSVRVTGFLFYDPDHARDLGSRRFTMWELHPVTRIEVWRNGQWVNLDDLN
jgi:hypothetical protein